MQCPRHEVADIIRQFGKEFIHTHHPNTWQQRTLNALEKCRTSALGGHKEQCDCCGRIRISYNSCGNRHCPKCQAARQAFWVEDCMTTILPVKHFHIVFTVPQELNVICMLDSRWFYNHFFAAVWDTLRRFGYSHFGVETGAMCILHSWGQNLSLHPHIHCLVPAVGLTLAGNTRYIGKKGKYLYPVLMLSPTFRKAFMNGIERYLKKNMLLIKYQHLLDKVSAKQWVVFCEPSFTKPGHVIGYLGQYTHRVAISNHRILRIDDQNVTFMHKDYRQQGNRRPVTLTGVEFLRRFCQHILPRGFVKIRYYGIYSSRFKTLSKDNENKIVIIPGETHRERLLRLSGFDSSLCPFCKTGRMVFIEIIPRVRSPSAVYMHKTIKA
jgi:hypothetical protein